MRAASRARPRARSRAAARRGGDRSRRRRRVLVRELEARLDRASPVEEELRRRASPRARLRPHRPARAARAAATGNSRSSRRRNEAGCVTRPSAPGAAPSSSCTSVDAGQDLLEVVEHQQRGVVAEPPRERVDERQVGASPRRRGRRRSPSRRSRRRGPAPGRRSRHRRARPRAPWRLRARAASCRCRPGR